MELRISRLLFYAETHTVKHSHIETDRDRQIKLKLRHTARSTQNATQRISALHCKLEIWGRAQRKAAPRRKSDCRDNFGGYTMPRAATPPMANEFASAYKVRAQLV